MRRFGLAAVATLLFAPALPAQPAAPTITSVVQGDLALTVVWEAPSGVTGITNYDVRYILTSADETNDANWTVKEDVGTERLVYLITGLPRNGFSYDVQVRAVTDTDGAWSATAAKTPADQGPDCSEGPTFPINVPIGGSLECCSEFSDAHRFELSGATGVVIESHGSLDISVYLAARQPDMTWTRIGYNDDSGQGTNFKLTASLEAGTYCAEVDIVASSPTVHAYHFEITALPDSTSRSNAHPLRLGGSAKEIVNGSGDEDYFTFTLSSETDVFIHGDPADWNLDAELQDSSGTALGTSVSSFIEERERQFFFRRKLAAGTYYVKVTAPGRTSGEYTVRLKTVTTPGADRDGAVDLNLAAPPGGSQAFGRIDSGTDADYFKIETPSAIHGYIRGVSNTVDIDAAIVDSSGNAVSADIFEETFKPSGPMGFTISGAPQCSGTHYLKVTRAASSTAAGGFVVWAVNDLTMDRYRSNCTFSPFTDPLGRCLWHLRNRAQVRYARRGEDVNVASVWDGGNMGAGVGVAVVDNGLHAAHPDLVDNVDTARNHDYVGNGLTLSFHPTELRFARHGGGGGHRRPRQHDRRAGGGAAGNPLRLQPVAIDRHVERIGRDDAQRGHDRGLEQQLGPSGRPDGGRGFERLGKRRSRPVSAADSGAGGPSTCSPRATAPGRTTTRTWAATRTTTG